MQQKRQSDEVAAKSGLGGQVRYHRTYRMPPLGLAYFIVLLAVLALAVLAGLQLLGLWLVVIAVADRGPGVDPESIARLFEKFYRAPSARTGGTGLGLSIVKGFVEAQGGQVTAENRKDGGMLFVISLPADKEPEVSLDQQPFIHQSANVVKSL